MNYPPAAVVMIAMLAQLAGGAGIVPSTATTQPIAPLLRKVIDWQLSLLPTEHVFWRDVPGGWIRAPFYDAVLAVDDATGDPRDMESITAIAVANHWDLLRRTRPAESGLPGDRSLDAASAKESYDRFPDDLVFGQVYETIWFHTHDDHAIAALRQRLDAIIADPLPGREEWWWCDALYMAPPTFARMSAITGDRKYLDYMDRQYWDVVGLLYNKDEHLFIRDKTFFKRTAANGKPIFWSRGNAWVLAGLAHILQAMPADYVARPKYVRLMNEMAEKLASLQQTDGFWRVSLLDPDEYTGKETSGTGFCCFALAWGINNGILPRDKYLPIVQKAWAALQTVVDPVTGRVGWVQPVASTPENVKESDIAEYGTAAFLYAGAEMLKLKPADTPLADNPSLTLTPAAIKKLIQTIHDDPQAKQHFDALRHTADEALSVQPNPIALVESEGKLANDPARIRSWKSLGDMPKMLALAYAFTVTGEAKYAEHARLFISEWARKNHSQGNPINDTNLEALIVAYDMVRGSYSEADRDAVDRYLRSVVAAEIKTGSTSSHTNVNNWNSHRLKIEGLIAFCLHDPDMIEHVRVAYWKQIALNLNPDGSSIDFQDRDALHYHIYDITPLLALALAARNNGIDLFDYQSPAGSSLRRSVDFLMPFETGEKTHAEFLHSTVDFDRKRAAAGQAEYKSGRLWEPRGGVAALERAELWEPSLLPLTAKLLDSTADRFPTWQIVINEANR